jgi:hypothetical protein
LTQDDDDDDDDDEQSGGGVCSDQGLSCTSFVGSYNNTKEDTKYCPWNELTVASSFVRGKGWGHGLMELSVLIHLRPDVISKFFLSWGFALVLFI